MTTQADIGAPTLPTKPEPLPVRTVARQAPVWRRRLILIVAMLLSGGLLIFPRMPLLLVMVLLCLAQRGFRFTFDRRMAAIVVLLVTILLVNLLRTGGQDLLALTTRYANFIAGLMLLRIYLSAPAGALSADLAAIMPWMAAQAILTVPLATAMPQLFLTVDVNETHYRTIAWIFTYHPTIEDAGLLPRPDGFFYEPGVLQIYLNLYLYVALFVRRHWTHTVFALVAVLATQSSTGIGIALLLLASFAMRSALRGTWSSRLLRVGGILIFLIPVSWVAQENISEKLFGESRGSAWARQYDLLTGINVIANNPVIGIGFEHERYIDVSRSLGYEGTALDEHITENRGNTNGIVFLVYSLGIPLALPFLIGLFRQSLFPDRLLIGTLILLSLMSESIVFTPFFLMIIFSGLLVKWHSPTRAAVRRLAE